MGAQPGESVRDLPKERQRMDVADFNTPSASLRRDVAFLTRLEPEVLKSFCKVALENLAGVRDFEAKLESAANSLSIEPQVLERGIESLAYLLTCMRKDELKESSRQSFLADLNFSEASSATIEDSYRMYAEKFEDTGGPSRTETHFKSLDWRLDVHLDTRATRNAPEAKYLLKLAVQDRNDEVKGRILGEAFSRNHKLRKIIRGHRPPLTEGNESTDNPPPPARALDILLESTYGRLCEITQSLEAALKEAKSSKTRRIIKLMQ